MPSSPVRLCVSLVCPLLSLSPGVRQGALSSRAAAAAVGDSTAKTKGMRLPPPAFGVHCCMGCSRGWKCALKSRIEGWRCLLCARFGHAGGHLSAALRRWPFVHPTGGGVVLFSCAAASLFWHCGAALVGEIGSSAFPCFDCREPQSRFLHGVPAEGAGAPSSLLSRACWWAGVRTAQPPGWRVPPLDCLGTAQHARPPSPPLSLATRPRWNLVCARRWWPHPSLAKHVGGDDEPRMRVDVLHRTAQRHLDD